MVELVCVSFLIMLADLKKAKVKSNIFEQVAYISISQTQMKCNYFG